MVTPHIGAKELYVTSGHYAKYGKDSFQPIHTPQEGEEYLLKPMNCPHHCEIFRSAPRSYRDLPLRFAEFGTVYRYEQSGELHGLTRVRSFTQDDAHLFCRQDQLQEEFEKVIDLILYVFKTLKFDKFTAQVSLRDPKNPSKYIGSDENWAKAERAPHPKALPQAVPNSFAEGMSMTDFDFVIANPEGYDLAPEFTKGIKVTHNQDEALEGADFVYAKNWASYEHYGEVLSKDRSWTVTKEKMALTNNAYFLHCLPVRRNMIVSDDVIESPQSLVIPEAANRVVSAQTVLKMMLQDL